MSDFDFKLNAWIQMNHPDYVKALATPELKDVRKLLANSGNGTTAPSQAALTGPGAAAAKTNPDWATNPALCAVNLANMARTAAGYDPTNLSNPSATAAQYQAFVTNLSSCPFFNLKISDSLNITKTSSDWDSLIESITNTFDGIAEADIQTIATGLKTIAQAASSQMSTTETQAVFVQNVMNVNNTYDYYLYSSMTSFIEEAGKGYDTKQSTFNVVRLKLELQLDVWEKNWPKVKQAFDHSIDDWLSDNQTSTAGTQPIKALE